MSTALLKFQPPAGISQPHSIDAAILASALEACPEPIGITENGSLVYANPKFEELSHSTTGESKSKDGAWQTTGFLADCRPFQLTTLRREFVAETLHLALMGRMVGGVAHDFNNLLTGILLYCDLLKTKVGNASPLGKKIEEIRHAAEQGAGIIRQLMSVGRESTTDYQLTNFNYALDELVPMLRHLTGENIRISTELAEHTGLVGISLAHAQQIVLNLVLNARDAMPDGGSLNLQTRTREFEGTGPARRMFELVVSDTGQGMEAAVASRIFEAFYTTKARGTGMGLATVRRIAEDAGGIVCLETAPGKGTRMTVRLPEIEAKNTGALPQTNQVVDPNLIES